MLDGFVQCQDAIVLEVTKEFHIRHNSSGRQEVRCVRYRYVGRELKKHVLLKYHNRHEDPNDCVHRVYDPITSLEIFSESLKRYQFPIFSEVLDELEMVVRKPGLC